MPPCRFGAVAVAGTFARDYPEYKVAGYAAAAYVALMQVPRCKHYPSDVGAGALLGLATAWVVNATDRAGDRAGAERNGGGR